MGTKKDKKKKLKKKGDVQEKVKPLKTNKSADTEDIDLILHELAMEHQQKYQITQETNCEPPSRRANCSLTVNPLDNELIMYGGEHYDGQTVSVYNDFFKYHLEKKEWKKVSSPNNPGPRTSHQVVVFPNGVLYLFGGEFVSPNESSFFHYKDFWQMDLKLGFEWKRVDCKCPPGRSGHRMVIWKHFIILFGGFYDQTNETRYYDDLWVFDTSNSTWIKIEIGQNELKPSPRSGFSMFMHGDLLFIYGGYSKITKGKLSKGVQHMDAWSMRFNTDLVQLKWEKKRKIGGITPGKRSGCSMAYYKGKGIFFGGVADIEEDVENLDSIVMGDMFQYLADSNKMYPLNLKSPKKSKKEKLLEMETTFQDDVKDELIPGPRYNAAIAIHKHTLYMFGGIFEIDSKEITLGDFWAINLEKLVAWDEIIKDEVDVSKMVDDSDSEDDLDEEEHKDEDVEIKDSADDLDEEELLTHKLMSKLGNNDPLPGGIY